MATKEERSLASRMFKFECGRANGHMFQSLFWDVMKAKHGPSFAAVSPQGSLGDGGNDGYLPEQKHYYQVFSPIDPKDRVHTATSKIADDFAKVKKQWGGKSGPGLKKFSFAFNRYKGRECSNH